MNSYKVARIGKRRYDWDSNDLDPLPGRKPVVLNPLKVFPSKNDTLTGAFWGVALDHHLKKIERVRKWLDPTTIDPQFGLEGTSPEDTLRRTFRRLESSALFTPPPKGSTSLTELLQDKFTTIEKNTSRMRQWSNPSPSKNRHRRDGHSPSVPSNDLDRPRQIYVLVEEEKLTELSKLETILRDERIRLGEQCTLVLADIQAHAHIPIPATRLALHNLCETEMKAASKKIMKLNRQWEQFCKQHHYNKPLVYLDKDPSFFGDSGPLAQRPIKLMMAREAVEKWKLNKERDTMAYEDDLSRLCDCYLTAQIRKKDYDRYYILATRYGRYTEEEFRRDGRPGRRYWIQVWRGAMKFQRLWERYWALALRRRHRAAKRVQTAWRRYFVMKRLGPILRIRKRAIKHSHYLHCFRRWQAYQKMCRRVKDYLQLLTFNFVPRCFDAWKNSVRQRIVWREEKERQWNQRYRLGPAVGRFHQWKRYRELARAQRHSLMNLVMYPEFKWWRSTVKQWKRKRLAMPAFNTLVRKFRKGVWRRNYAMLNKMALVLTARVRQIAAWHRLKRLKQTAIDREFSEWGPREIVRREERQHTREDVRRDREEEAVKEREKAERKALKQFLNEEGGRMQLHEMIAARGFGLGSTILRAVGLEEDDSEARLQQLKAARRELVERCSQLVRPMARHDFRTKQAPFLLCPSPNCAASCASEAQYLNHLVACADHTISHPLCGLWNTLPDEMAPPSSLSLSMSAVPSSFTSPLAGADDAHRASLLTTAVSNGDITAAAPPPTSTPASAPAPAPESAATSATASIHPSHRHFVDLHLLLNNAPLGPALLREHLSSRHGVGTSVHCLEAWLAIQEWKRIRTSSEDYHKKAMEIHDLYLRPDGLRALKWSLPGLFRGEAAVEAAAEAARVLQRVKGREYVGFYEGARAKASLLRRITGRKGKQFEKWTDHQVVPPNVFNFVAWYCFVVLYREYESSFVNSREHAAYRTHQAKQVTEKQQRLMSDFLNVRWSRFMDIGREVKGVLVKQAKEQQRVEEEIDFLSGKVADKLLRNEVVRVVGDQMHHAVTEVWFEVRCDEREVAEGVEAMTDELMEWLEERVVEEIFTYYTRALLKGMWDKPEYRDGLLEYAGLLKRPADDRTRKFGGTMQQRQQNEKFFAQVLRGASANEKDEFPISLEEAATRLQRWVRGIQGRKMAKKEFSLVFAKRYDPQLKLYFYINNVTATSSWDRPRLYQRLFPNGRW